MFGCLSASISPEPHAIFTKFLCLLPVAVIRSYSSEIVRYLPHKKNKISDASQTVSTARFAPKICQTSLQHLAYNIPNFIQIGSLSAEL